LSFIDREQVGHITILRFSRPEVCHAINRPMLEQFASLLYELSMDTATRVVVITGVGDKAFCAGADLKERQMMSEEEVRAYILLIRATFTQLEQLPQPVIAAINGFALGGGVELALACDLRIADERATLALPETSLGIIPGAGGTQRLTRIAGVAIAKEFIFTARRITAVEAYQYGIVNKVTTLGRALSVSLAIADQIASNAPLAVQQAKFSIREGYALPFADALEIETQAYDTLISTKDRLEGLRAFQTKRIPNYRGE
jgi:enoyl-CoA hydratase/carnithine racemase